MIGSIIDGRYRILRLLGAGAMGSVYEAEHTGTRRRVALKVIKVSDPSSKATMIGRFQREARAAGAIDTQYITQVFDTGTDPDSGQPYMVMEYLKGESLHQALKRTGPLAPDLALRLIAQTCLGLQKAHEAQVVHRDLKPANLFLARRDAGEIIVKILDFGIAKVMAPDISEEGVLTHTGSVIGSPLFMSPEQARGSKDIDHRADIWSLGVVLYQMLAGRTPYKDKNTSFGTLLIAICRELPPPITDFAPWVSPDIAAIVHGAMKHDPNERFQSAQAMFEAVRALLPSGFSVTEEMIAPLPDAFRSSGAPRLLSDRPPPRGPDSVAPPPSSSAAHLAGSTGRTSRMGGTGTSAQTNPPSSVGNWSGLTDQVSRGSASQSSSVGGASSPSTSSSSETSPSKPRPRTALFAGTALVGTLGGALIFFLVVSSRSPAEPMPNAPDPDKATTSAPAPQPTPVVEVAPSAPEPAPNPATRRVKLVVFPEDASVEVDDKLVPSRNGIVEITGPLGSIHKVRVFRGPIESRQEVIVSEIGASPPKIELTIPFSARSPAAGPTAGPTAAPAPTPTVPPDIKPTFE